MGENKKPTGSGVHDDAKKTNGHTKTNGDKNNPLPGRTPSKAFIEALDAVEKDKNKK